MEWALIVREGDSGSTGVVAARSSARHKYLLTARVRKYYAIATVHAVGG